MKKLQRNAAALLAACVLAAKADCTAKSHSEYNLVDKLGLKDPNTASAGADFWVGAKVSVCNFILTYYSGIAVCIVCKGLFRQCLPWS